ncbi:MAG: hypothetical protein IKA46_02890 [Clostridia bacterium]|nr:hypothetical protein [Clostridia bacterium]MBR3862733.1 hypothetical protein [Clostridia bacterium]
MDRETVKASLRKLREEKCFPIVNRGSFWYESLTEEQVVELREWYAAWLDVTATFKIPSAPKWLKG